jgi:hypothetical protein
VVLATPSRDEIAELLPLLTKQERAEVMRLLRLLDRPWFPLPGPQTMAYNSKADIVGYGGAAGGGKTDLACGSIITRHQKAMVLRRVGTELTGILDRFTDLLKGRDGYNGQDKIWRTKRFDGKPLQIEFGAVPNLGDEKKYQGRPHDKLVFDEAANFLESQVRFLLGWLRSVDPTQFCQALLCFNPPTSAEGRWIIDFFAPWLDPKHPLYPTAPGALRLAAMIPGENGVSKDAWVDRPDPFVLVDGEITYDFDPAEYVGVRATEIITPRSRTFIPSRVTDNPHLYGTGYMSQLQALPEPLRSQMLNGDFRAGMEDDPWQVIPTAWVEAAQERWRKPDVLARMDSLGVDVARGGRDNTVIARRHGNWFDAPLVYAGTVTPDGPKVAGLAIAALRDRAPIHIDVIGVGSSPYDFLMQARQQVIGVNVAESARGLDKSGRLSFVNLRSELWWRMREALDPTNNIGIALPPSGQLLVELCAPTWELQGAKIKVESREQIVERIGVSPDLASAYVLALIDTPRMADIERRSQGKGGDDYDPYA